MFVDDGEPVEFELWCGKLKTDSVYKNIKMKIPDFPKLFSLLFCKPLCIIYILIEAARDKTRMRV